MFKILDGREHFYQWDIDRKLIVEDREVKQVHFCNRTEECSLVCEPYEEAGLWVVNVPNVLLQEPWRINVFAYDTNYTKHSAIFTVSARSKPESYVYTETEILNYNTLLERIENVEANGGGGGCIIGDSVEEIHIGTEAPTDENIKVWINPEESLKDEFATVGYVDNAVGGLPNHEYIDNALAGFGEGYYTKTEIDEALANIPSSGGGSGCDVYYFEGSDYNSFTDNDKAKIQEIWDYAEANDGKLMPTIFYYRGTAEEGGAWRTITHFYKNSNSFQMCYVQTQNEQLWGFIAYKNSNGSWSYNLASACTAAPHSWYWNDSVSDNAIYGIGDYTHLKVVGYMDGSNYRMTLDVSASGGNSFYQESGNCYYCLASEGTALTCVEFNNGYDSMTIQCFNLSPDGTEYSFYPIGYYYWR